MITVSSDDDRRQIPFISLVPFLLIAFGLAWGILALFIFLPDQMTGIFGELTGQHPLFFLAVYAPAIAAFIIVTYNAGIGGLRRYLSRLLLWRCSLPWYTFLIIGIPLIYIGGSALKGNLFTEPFPFSSFQSLIVALALTAIKGPVEEFGWRGLALPLLQRKLAPIWAALILGIIWGFWHLPAFLLSGTQQSAWSFTPFFFGSIALSVIVTALFNTSHGSILLPALFHFCLNNPVWPDAQPYDIYLFMVVAVLVVWFNRKTMFNREGAITEVVPLAEGNVSLETIQGKPLEPLHRND
ncbi:MAG: CPBP family intramembrane metalloprotease [Deltaproteobacteria bacterium]|nr:CPBP family intramembrane metalloprotease [Deltaproteobacteria bacterium]